MTFKITKFKLLASLSVLYALAIFYMSAQSSIDIPKSITHLPALYWARDQLLDLGLMPVIDLVHYTYDHRDKVLHMGLYFGFGVLLHLSFRNSQNVFLRRYAAIFAILVGISYGITDELHQSFVPGRSSSKWDLLADSIGVVLAQVGIIVLTIRYLWGKKDENKERTDPK